jgi:integrase
MTKGRNTEVEAGARKREVLDAKWTDIDLDRRVWRIHINKSGKARHVRSLQGLCSY